MRPTRRRWVEVLALVVLATIAGAVTYGIGARRVEGVRERYARELDMHCRHARASAERGLARMAQLAEHPRSVESIAFRETLDDSRMRERWRQRCATTRLPALPVQPTVTSLRAYLDAVIARIPDAEPGPTRVEGML